MGFEDFSVTLTGGQVLSNVSPGDITLTLHNHLTDLNNCQFELETVRSSRDIDDVIIRTNLGVVILQILWDFKPPNQVKNLYLNFAYCNPQSVNDLYFEIAEWLMISFDLTCYPSRDYAPSQVASSEVCKEFCQPELIHNLLEPSIEYNRGLWQLDAKSAEEKLFTPDEAIQYFFKLK